MLQGISDAWLPIIQTDDLTDIHRAVLHLTPGDKLCPPIAQWFNWARILDNPDRIRVVIVGMDPYPQRKNAHGLAFSSLSSVPQSLRNIFRCLVQSNLMVDINVSGDLTTWAEQGVLLVNAYLSTEVGVPGKHAKLWRPYMPRVIAKISDFGIEHGRSYCFLLWGKDAQKLQTYINADHHNVMTWLHPSPMAQISASPEDKFINCDHFLRVNEHLVNMGESPINWQLVPAAPKSKAKGKRGATKVNKPVVGRIRSVDSVDVADPADPVDVADPVNVADPVDPANSANIANSGEPANLIIKTVEKIFTDGACTNNGKRNARGAYAAIFVEGQWVGKTLCGGLPSCDVADSNIRAEGWAIAKVLEFLRRADWQECEIYTDSEFWVKMVYDYMPKWSPATFRKKKNPDLTTHVWGLWSTINALKHPIKLVWVPAHNKRGGRNSADAYTKWCHDNNDAVDKLATATCQNL